MTGDPRPLVTRLGRASPARGVGRSPPGVRGWVGAMALLGALGLSGCDDGGESPGGGDGGAADAAVDASGADARRPDAMAPDAMSPDAMSPDATANDATATDAMAPDALAPDAMSPDAGLPDAEPAPQAVLPTVTAGGGTVESGRYRLRVSLGGPSPMHVTSSDRLQARIGVALPLPDTEEQPR